jgi:uncharacterized lipoprotein
MKLFKLLSVSILALMLGACAFVPESVHVNPTLSTKKSNIGHGKKVAVRVVDARSDTTLGGRASGYGPAAKISLANKLGKAVKKTIYRGLRTKGFRPVPYYDGSRRKLVVRITGLQYKTRTGFWVGHVSVTGAIDANANVAGRSFERVYRAKANEGIMFTPSERSDVKHINAAISLMINKLINDKQLMHFLAR